MAGIYTTLIRGVPDLVLMLLIFFGGQMAVNQIAESFGYEEYIEVNAFTAGVLTIGFIYGAYMTETFRGAILAVPPGQLEAGQAFGMSRFQVFREILLPQTIRYALPGFGNNWLVLLKTTALLSVIGLDDMLFTGRQGGRGHPRALHLLSRRRADLPAADHRLHAAPGLGGAQRRAALPAARPWTLASSSATCPSTSRGCGPRSGWWRRPWRWAFAVDPAGGGADLGQPAAELARSGPTPTSFAARRCSSSCS